MTKLFGTDGIRGRVGESMTEEIAYQVGLSAGTYFANAGEHIRLGYDTRESSLKFASALSAGIIAVGANVDLLGVIPTPGLAYLTEYSAAKAGIMITASHNSYQDNGIKIFNASGEKLTDKNQQDLNELINSNIAAKGRGNIYDVRDDRRRYVRFLSRAVSFKSAKNNLRGLPIVIDMANGATTSFAETAFYNAGADVWPMNDRPNGRNINDHNGTTDTSELQSIIRKVPAAMGVAFDGDGDRVMLVDNLGRQLNGDHILYINALTGGESGVVGTEMSNKGLEDALAFVGIKLERRKVGDRHVLEGLQDTGYMLGGEQSGHVIMKDISATGDGILTALQTIKRVRASGSSLAEWYDAVPMLPQKIVNISVSNPDQLNQPNIQEFISQAAVEVGNTGRLNVRASGTESLVRVMVESDEAEAKAQRIAAGLQKLLST